VTPQILVIDDDPAIRNNVVELLEEEGFGVSAADNGIDGVALAIGHEPALIICDIGMPGMDGYAVLRAVRTHATTADVPFIFLTAKTERAEVRLGMNLGADDYLTKPFTLEELIQAVHSRLKRADELAARARATLVQEPESSDPGLQSAVSQREGIVVLDPAMHALYAQAAKAAQSDINILILGETGVGKEILARSIHNQSRRSTGTFVALNCAALTETLLEAELFGHERGAFTGAHQAKPGLLETASGGTVFLDEIGELPLPIQTKLLRVLEDRTVMRVGARASRKIDVRFLAATNRDLEEASTAGSFREDLYYRLNGISFVIPPLRERRGEIAPLCKMFIARASAQHAFARSISIHQQTMDLLIDYTWPGNVRQLRNVMERAVVLCEGQQLLPEHLPEKLRTRATSNPRPPLLGSDRRERLEKDLQDIERHRILEALEKTAGNQTLAAALLGMSRRTLVYRLSAFGLTRARKRA
jgi:DNA-binding NtrC family response regulator